MESRIAILFFCLALPLIFVIADHTSISTGLVSASALGVASSITILLLASFRIAGILQQKQMAVLRLTFYSFVYVFFGVIGTIQNVNGIYPLGGAYASGTIVSSNLLILSGLLFLEVGFFLGRRAASLSALKRHPSELRTRAAGRVAFYLSVGAILAVATSILTLFLSGTAESILLPRNDRLDSLFGGKRSDIALLIDSIVRIPCWIFAAAYLALFRIAGRAALSPIDIAIGLVTVAIALVLNNPISTPRFLVGAVWISFAIASLGWSRALGTLYFVAITLGLLVIFPVLSVYRENPEAELGTVLLSWDLVESVLRTGDFDSYQQVLNAMDYVQEHGLTWGAQLAAVAFYWVPREFWPDKPLSTGMLVAEWVGYSFTNLSMPLWAEFFVDGHLVAVAIGFVMLGRLFFRLESAAINTNAPIANQVLAMLVLALLTGMQTIILRGSLLGVVTLILPIGLCAFVTYALMSLPGRPSTVNSDVLVQRRQNRAR
jgi:hypothetical protein